MVFLVNPYSIQAPTPQTLQIGAGTSSDNKAPFYGLYDYSAEYFIWLQSEIGSGTKTINSIEMEFTGYSTPYYYNNLTIKLAHTTDSTIPASTKTDLTGMTYSDLTTCYNDNFTVSGSGWLEFTFSTPFVYDGSDNLLILFENRDGTWVSGYGAVKTWTDSTFRWFYKYQDTTYPTSEYGTRDSTDIPNLKINYTA